ncbi:calcium-dependent protein kinase 4-like [Miscanthus floridulus]|uniref:calcium-dependent protein kinase 4-like n=1 Tax=Miscanthus floridulus TaxID=154761 RepID=UPI00345B35DE
MPDIVFTIGGKKFKLRPKLCEGGELLHRILAKKNSCYSEKDAVAIVRQMLKVVVECRLPGLVHRDMKPESVHQKSSIINPLNPIMKHRHIAM